MNTIHSDNDNMELGNTCEIANNNYEQMICNTLAEEIAKMLDINWIDRTLFTKMFTVNLSNIMNGNNGLLEQYLHTQLDIIAKKLNRDFNLNELSEENKKSLKKGDKKIIDEKTGYIKVNYTHATHAKLNSVIEAVLLKYVCENTKLKSEIAKLKDQIHTGFGGNT